MSPVDERGPAPFGQETDNTAKFDGAAGLESRLLDRFRTRLLARVEPLPSRHILDAGCGEGFVTSWLAESHPGAELTAVDGRADALDQLSARMPGVRTIEADLTDLPLGSDCFDLVVCTEVLEHLPAPEAVLNELRRVCSGHVLVTVPFEPFFRIGNLARGRYVGRLGSTPGHRSTWSRRGFTRLVESQLGPGVWFSLFPWQGLLVPIGS